MRIKLPIYEKDSTKTYTMPDPDALSESYDRVYRHHFCRGPEPSQIDISNVLALADGYLTLTTYTLGQSCCVGKLKDIWRHRRAKGNA